MIGCETKVSPAQNSHDEQVVIEHPYDNNRHLLIVLGDFHPSARALSIEIDGKEYVLEQRTVIVSALTEIRPKSVSIIAGLNPFPQAEKEANWLKEICEKLDAHVEIDLYAYHSELINQEWEKARQKEFGKTRQNKR
jgi:hypothetical protein